MANDPVPGGDVPDNVTLVPTSDNTPQSARQAADSLLDYRRKRDNPQEEAPKEAAAPAPEPSKEAAAPAEEATSETPTETTAEPATEPSIEPPRSWTKEQKERFKSYPRDAQETISAEAARRETDFRRGQNELAEQRKAMEAERHTVEQARTQYEQALPALLQTLHQQQQGEFQDIRTMADVEKLAREDWPRYALWDAQQKKIAAVTNEINQTEARRSQEKQTHWQTFAQKEDAAFIEHAPELADPDKAGKVAKAAMELLTDVGFSQTELASFWNGQESPSLRDHRMQLLIRDAVKYREAAKAITTKVAKPVPPVQRPGTAAPQGAADDARLKNLEQKLDKSGKWKDAAEFLMARRAAARR